MLNAYDQRQCAVTVMFTMDSLEVMTAERQEYQDFQLSTTGPQPFSISNNSSGLQLLVNLLSTANTDLGVCDNPSATHQPAGGPPVHSATAAKERDCSAASWQLGALSPAESRHGRQIDVNNSR